MENIEADAITLLEKWTKILSLQDWRIKIQFDEEENMAKIDYSFRRHVAIIHIMPPAQWGGANVFFEPISLENLIVHELIHLHLVQFFPKKRLQTELAELAINQLTDAFLKLDHQLSNFKSWMEKPSPEEKTKET